MSWGIFLEAIIWIVGGAIAVITYFFIARDIAYLQMPSWILIAFGNILMLLIFLRAFSRQRREMQADFYSYNKQARLERACHRAYKLYERGQWEIKGDGEIRKKWDRDIRQFLDGNIGQQALDYYCSRTGRGVSGSEDRVLSEEEMIVALRVIEGFLETDFENYFER